MNKIVWIALTLCIFFLAPPTAQAWRQVDMTTTLTPRGPVVGQQRENVPQWVLNAFVWPAAGITTAPAHLTRMHYTHDFPAFSSLVVLPDALGGSFDLLPSSAPVTIGAGVRYVSVLQFTARVSVPDNLQITTTTASAILDTIPPVGTTRSHATLMPSSLPNWDAAFAPIGVHGSLMPGGRFFLIGPQHWIEGQTGTLSPGGIESSHEQYRVNGVQVVGVNGDSVIFFYAAATATTPYMFGGSLTKQVRWVGSPSGGNVDLRPGFSFSSSLRNVVLGPPEIDSRTINAPSASQRAYRYDFFAMGVSRVTTDPVRVAAVANIIGGGQGLPLIPPDGILTDPNILRIPSSELTATVPNIGDDRGAWAVWIGQTMERLTNPVQTFVDNLFWWLDLFPDQGINERID